MYVAQAKLRSGLIDRSPGGLSLGHFHGDTHPTAKNIEYHPLAMMRMVDRRMIVAVGSYCLNSVDRFVQRIGGRKHIARQRFAVIIFNVAISMGWRPKLAARPFV